MKSEPKPGGQELHTLKEYITAIWLQAAKNPCSCVMQTPPYSQPASNTWFHREESFTVSKMLKSSVVVLALPPTIIHFLAYLFRLCILDKHYLSPHEKKNQKKTNGCSVLISKHANKLSSLIVLTPCYTGKQTFVPYST